MTYKVKSVPSRFFDELMSGTWNNKAPIKIDEKVEKIAGLASDTTPIGAKGVVLANIYTLEKGWVYYVRFDGFEVPCMITGRKIKKIRN